jgi:hypothetical protein
MYDIKNKQWCGVGNGVPTIASCLCIDDINNVLYVGGVFSKVGKGENSIQVKNIAAYYINEKRWLPLGDGLNRECCSMILDNDTRKLYAVGSFTQSGTKKVQYIGEYDIEKDEWNSLKGGDVNGPCRCIIKPNANDIYVGGLFTHAGTSDIHVSYVAKYDLKKDTWSDLLGGLQGYCNDLSFDKEDNSIYVGGTFSSVGSYDNMLESNNIAKFHIEHQIWDNMNGGVNNVVNSIYMGKDGYLYVGGIFTHSHDDMRLNSIGKYDTQKMKWLPLENSFVKMKTDNESDNIGVNGPCKVISMDEKSLFVAGKFEIAGNITANSIVRYMLTR